MRMYAANYYAPPKGYCCICVDEYAASVNPKNCKTFSWNKAELNGLRKKDWLDDDRRGQAALDEVASTWVCFVRLGVLCVPTYQMVDAWLLVLIDLIDTESFC